MSYEWELFEVGMKRGEWLGLPEGMVMDWSDDCGLILFVFYNQPSAKEKNDMAAGSRFEIRFKDISGIGFFSVKFGEQSWSDCAFSPNLYPDIPKFEKPPKGKTYALHVMLVDTSVGELKILRTIALGKEFSEHFRLWCLASLDKNIGQRYYNRVVEEVFEKYPTSETLAKAADIHWICAHGEDEPKREGHDRE